MIIASVVAVASVLHNSFCLQVVENVLLRASERSERSEFFRI